MISFAYKLLELSLEVSVVRQGIRAGVVSNSTVPRKGTIYTAGMI